jgi:hypothetical protein
MAKVSGLATLIAGLLIAALAGNAHASVVYTLTLTATYDSDGTPLSDYNGSGSITLSSAPNPTGQTDYTSAPVSFLVDGEAFSGTATGVQFLDGNFRNATFSEQIGSNPNRFALHTTSEYVFYYDNELQDASGSITSSLATTPLPTALPLFAGGLTALGFFGLRKRRKSGSLTGNFNGDAI